MEREFANTLLIHKNDCETSFKTYNGNRGVSILLKKNILAISVIFLLSFQGFSQSKYEKEFRIKAKDVPSSALAFVDSMTFDSKVKWDKEIGLNDVTIEAKAKFKNERHSIEFSENGIFQDVEIVVKPNQIPFDAFSKISGILSQRHKKHKIEKVQVQYSGDRNLVMRYLKENRNNPNGITINFEVVISTKLNGNYIMLEYLFSETGEYVASNQIISKRKDTIDY